MLRSVLAVIAGYAAMVVIVVAGFAVSLIVPSMIYQPNTLDVTTGWLAYTIGLSLVGAVAGGFLCAMIAREFRPVVALAVFALAFGVFEAVRNSQRERPSKTAQEIVAMSMMDKAKIGVQPTAYSWSLPFIAAAGIFIGGRLKK